MKYKLFFWLTVIFFLSVSCNKDKISLNIISPADGAVFNVNDKIEVSITATTKKGSIKQVILFVDTINTISFTKPPYDTIIPKQTFKDEGMFYLSVRAYSSQGVQEGKSIYIKIEK